MHRGLQQDTGSRAQTHHALPISTFFPKCKGLLVYRQHLSAGLTSKGRGASDPSHGLSRGQRGKKRKTKRCLQDSLAPSNSTSPIDAASLSLLILLTSLFPSAAQRWGFEARCPEGAKSPVRSSAPGSFGLQTQGLSALAWAVCRAACSRSPDDAAV